MKKISILFIFWTLVIGYAIAQDSLAFKPSGRIFGTGFFDYRIGINNENNESGFNLTRALVGYEYKFTPQMQAKVSLDGAAEQDISGKLEPHVKNAYVSWNDKGLEVSVGLIGLTQFKLQQNFWQRRYVLKSYQNENKMGASADVGIVAQYEFMSTMSADFSISNGEGYKNIKNDNTLRYSLGANFIPNDKFVFRVYGDIYTKDDNADDTTISWEIKNQYTLALFAGYDYGIFSLGAEYNRQFNRWFIGENSYTGCSFYTNINIAPKWDVYGRFDLTEADSKSTDNRYEQDSRLYIIGIEFLPHKYVKISPNFRYNKFETLPSEKYVFLSTMFNF